MKIDDKIANYDINRQLPKLISDIKEGAQLSGEKHAESTGDAIVSLSRASKEVRLANEVISSTPDIRDNKVSELKEKIKTGTYEINTRSVAAKIVDAFMNNIF